MATNDKDYIIITQYGLSGNDSELKISREDKRCIGVISCPPKPPTARLEFNFLSLFTVLTVLKPGNLYRMICTTLRTLLLPIGYPDSVCPEYIMFQLWDTSQEACGYFRGILNNQAWLTNLGVGNPNTTIVSAVILTMILDYANMLCGLLIAGSPRIIRMFDANQKFWTMFKEYMSFLSTILTLTSNIYPQYMLRILLAGKIVDAAVSVMSGTCRSALVTHIARKNNFSDCNAKEGNQSRTLKLVMIGIGYQFLIFVNESGHRVLWAFIILSLSKIFCQYKAMSTLRLRTFNTKRLQDCINAWCIKDFEKMDVSYIASHEPVLYPQYGSISLLGSPIQSLDCSGERFSSLTVLHKNVKHVLVPSESTDNMRVLIKEGARDHDILMAYVHYFIHHYLRNLETNEAIQLVENSLEITSTNFTNIKNMFQEKGWDTGNLSLLPTTNIRTEFQFSSDCSVTDQDNEVTDESKKTV